MFVIINFVYLISLVIWIGGMVFFSFFAAPSIFKVLPRETAGDVVGDIFPKYWMMGYISGILALLSSLILSFRGKGLFWLRILFLLTMTAMTFYSGLVVGPKAREIKKEIRMTQDPDRKESLKERFKEIHQKSSLLNACIILVGVLLILFTAYQLS